MLLFSFLKDIIYRKEGKLLDKPENYSEFEPYLIQRWLSMYSPNTARLLNITCNSLYSSYETKKDWYKIFLIIIPKTFFKKIKYIKKPKKVNNKIDNTEQVINHYAKIYEMSIREVRDYIKEFNIDISKEKKALKE